MASPFPGMDPYLGDSRTQAAPNLVYERNGYADRLDYAVPPPPRLPPADAAWAEDQVRGWLARP